MAMDWIKNPRTQKVLRIVGMILFGLAVFVISIGFTLPEDRLKSYIESMAAKSGLALSIEDLDVRGFGAMTLSGVKLEFPPAVSTAPDGSRIEKPRSLALDELKINVSLLSTIFGTPAVRVTANQGGGHLGPVDIKVNAEDIEIEIREIVDFPLPGGLPVGPLSLSGVIESGSGRLLWNKEAGLSGSEGAIEIVADDMVARDPVLNSRQAGAISLTDIALGRLEASVIIDKRSSIAALKQGRRGAGGADSRVLYFETLKLEGKDISAMIEGNSVIRLMAGRDMSKSQITAELAFAINDSFFDKGVKGSDDKPNKFLKTLLDMDPRWKSARSGRFYGLICTGTLADPNCIPRKPSVRGGDFKLPGKEDSEDTGEDAPTSRKAATQKKRVTTPRTAPVQDETGAVQERNSRAPAGETGAGESPDEESGASETGAVGEVRLDRNGSRAGMGSRMTRPVGGTIVDDSSGEMAVPSPATPVIRMQEPGEPTEE